MRTTNLIAIAGVVTVACMPLQQATAEPEYYTLKAGSYHCARPEPLANVDEYLAQVPDCLQAEHDWWLIAPPETVETDVVKIDMGGRFGIRYARAANVILEAAKPGTD